MERPPGPGASGSPPARVAVCPSASHPAVSKHHRGDFMSRIALLALALGVVAALPAPAQRATRARPRARASARATARSSQPAPIVIPYQRFVLKNGLTLLVHEDQIGRAHV